jgi:drug/metabolite transporter (DMT)-like permease
LAESEEVMPRHPFSGILPPSHHSSSFLELAAAMTGRLSAADNRRQTFGMLSVAAGVSVFSLQDAIMKGMSGTYPVHEIVFVRSLVAFPLLLMVSLVEARGWPTFKRLGLHCLRGLLMFISFGTYYLAIAKLQIAETVALFYVAPLLVTALSAPFLGEKVRNGSWIAIAIGSAGTLVVLHPGFGMLDWALFLPLLSALAYALSALCSRRLGQSQSGAAMALSATVVYILASAATAIALAGTSPPAGAGASITFLLNPWLWPNAVDLGLMAACGVISAAAFFFLGQGYRMAEANRAAPFEYASLPWAILWGYVFFGNLPELATVLGALVIVCGGLYALRMGSAGPSSKLALVTLSEEDKP